MNTWFTALAATVSLALPLAASADVVTPPPVPANLRVDAPNAAFLLGRGVGTQNYICVPSPRVGQVNWILFTPEAHLFSDLHEQLTSHFFSPNPFEATANPFQNGVVRATWRDSRDSSTVWARAIASSVDAAFVEAGAVPWLLLEVVGGQAGPTGGTTLSRSTFIHRVNTSGGAAPTTGCDLPTDVGRQAFVPYTADYIFYTK